MSVGNHCRCAFLLLETFHTSGCVCLQSRQSKVSINLSTPGKEPFCQKEPCLTHVLFTVYISALFMVTADQRLRPKLLAWEGSFQPSMKREVLERLVDIIFVWCSHRDHFCHAVQPQHSAPSWGALFKHIPWKWTSNLPCYFTWSRPLSLLVVSPTFCTYFGGLPIKTCSLISTRLGSDVLKVSRFLRIWF